MITLLSTLLLSLQPLFVLASNDWTHACSGSCSYESGDGITKAWGTILIDGSPEAVSDITTASGWSIMGCNATSQEEQHVRIVCHDPAAGCEQLFEGGAADTIVRLPEDCADAPFARVVSVESSTNQTVSSLVARRISQAKAKRSTPPEVLTITFDFNFHLIPPSRGTISLTALATTNPLQRPLATVQHVRRALGYSDDGALNARSSTSAGELVSREIRRRDLFADFVKSNTIPDDIAANVLRTSTGLSMKGASNATRTPSGKFGIGDWSKDWNKQFNLIDIDESFNVVDAKLSCPQSGDMPAFDASIRIDADVDVRATVTVGFILSGTILPPLITKAAFTSALDGEASATFKIAALAQGSFNTGLLPLYSSGLAGLSIPGIIDVGPSFSINGQGIGKVGVSTEAVVKADYKFPHLSMVIPRDEGGSSGEATQTEQPNPLSLSIGGSAKLYGAVEAHLIPRVDLGVKVLSGVASASVFLQLDGYGALNMDLTLEGGASTAVGAADGNRDATSTIPQLPAATADLIDSSSTSTVPTAVEDLESEEAIASTSEAKQLEPTSTFTPEETPIPIPAASPENLGVEAGDVPVTEPETHNDVYNDRTEPETNAVSPPAIVSPVIPPALEAVPMSSHCPTRRTRRHLRRSAKHGDVVVHHKPRAASGSYSGCVGVDMGVKIVAGAQGKLLSFWNESVTFDIFHKKWDIFEKCFQGNFKRSSSIHDAPFSSSLLSARQLEGLICPAITDAVSANNQIV